MINKIKNNISQYNSFIKMQLLTLFLFVYSSSFIIPILIKLQGILWTTYFIALYMLISQSSTFLLPFFKKIPIKNIYLSFIILDCLYLISLPFYFYDKTIFLLIEATLSIGYGLLGKLFSISFRIFILDTYGKKIFTEIQYTEQIIIAVGAILGFTSLIITEYIFNFQIYSIYYFANVLIFIIIIHLYNYNKYWKNK